MNKDKRIMILSVVVVSLVMVTATSGCVDSVENVLKNLFGSIGNVFGMEVVKPSRVTDSVGVTNPVIIENAWTLPNNEVLPDSNVKFMMEISNLDDDPDKKVKNLFVDLFDATVFKASKNPGDFCNIAPNKCLPNDCSKNNKCTMSMGSTKQVRFDIWSPSSKEIAKVYTKGTLNYLLRYDYNGSTNYEILVVNYDEILRRQQEAKALSASLQDTRGGGPIKIDVELRTPYVVAGSPKNPDKSQTAYFVFKLRNAGAGSLSSCTNKDGKSINNAICMGKFKIKFPDGLGHVSEHDPVFSCSGGVCTNSEDVIQLFRGETQPFTFKIEDVNNLPGGVPYRSFFINADVQYSYELRGSVQLNVNPNLA